MGLQIVAFFLISADFCVCTCALRSGWPSLPHPSSPTPSSITQRSCILSYYAILALVLDDLGPLSLSISGLGFPGTRHCENWIRWLPMSHGLQSADNSKSQVFATSGTFCHEKLQAVMEEQAYMEI